MIEIYGNNFGTFVDKVIQCDCCNSIKTCYSFDFYGNIEYGGNPIAWLCEDCYDNFVEGWLQGLQFRENDY